HFRSTATVPSSWGHRASVLFSEVPTGTLLFCQLSRGGRGVVSWCAFSFTGPPVSSSAGISLSSIIREMPQDYKNYFMLSVRKRVQRARERCFPMCVLCRLLPRFFVQHKSDREATFPVFFDNTLPHVVTYCGEGINDTRGCRG